MRVEGTVAMDFRAIVEKICDKSPLQRKRLTAYLETCDADFFKEADEFVARYQHFLDRKGISIEYALNAYLNMCSNMLRCQVGFMRTGRYPVDSAEAAKQAVYESEVEMLSYMVGLGISQFLWPTHYKMFSFFKEAVDEASGSIKNYLEIGPGHGLLLDHALSSCSSLSRVVAIDISPTSLELSKSIIQLFNPSNSVEFLLGDVTKTDLGTGFDFITMGEVLEHVEQPQLLLARLKALLLPGGKAFISTCANCPAIDHVHQFDNVGQIREMITSSGLRIVRDSPLPVENMTVEKAEAQRITINYCALLEA
jgi:SAM-dependent methyltransferase